MLAHEHKAKKDGFEIIVGIDEAGRGPLAGPVVAAAVCISDHHFFSRIDDSKILTEKQREAAFDEIVTKCDFGVGLMDEAAIDQHNILKATFKAMREAVMDLSRQIRLPKEKVCLLVDGPVFESDLPYEVRTITGGDGVSLSIACASIVAKVTRDRLLLAYDKFFPEYGFARHKGYPTKEHKQAIAKHGLCPIHRRTFNYV